ncbi:MAG TPA: HDOD domain-containing protein [Myxococcales bacterium]|nr:HDOD domain-containing protein [Myxococcales bacterium]
MTRRLLVVDDEQLVCSAMRRTLGKVGYEVVFAESGEDALSKLGPGAFGCLITDLRMPGMGGHGLIRECRQRHPTLPIIVMSAHGDMDDVIECLREGVADYIRKPWSDSEVRATVARHFRTDAAPAAAATPVPQAPPHAAHAPAEPPAAPSSPPSVPDPSVQERRSALLRKIATGDLALPTSPAVTLAMRSVASSDHASASSLRELAERDVGLAAQIIKVANGPLYAGLGRVSSLQAAIARIGFRELSHLAEALMAQRFFDFSEKRWQELLCSVWRQSWRRAVIARFLAEHAKVGITPERAYLSALFCDLGVPLLCRALQKHAPELDQAEAVAFVEASHAAFGATVAAHWSLPPECALVCGRHHFEPGAPDEVPMPLRLVWAAESLAVSHFGSATHPDMPSPDSQLLPLSHATVATVMELVDEYVEQHGWALDDAVGGPITDSPPPATHRAAAP